jgi:hypothetical protein
MPRWILLKVFGFGKWWAVVDLGCSYNVGTRKAHLEIPYTSSRESPYIGAHPKMDMEAATDQITKLRATTSGAKSHGRE